ncbi:hypothetical protein E8E95_20315 [Pseudomonas sp. BN414]|uniref:amidohydrolase family protein n=1 Tax=Pseudomonas sp. BN414 TaxID=2567888 RepID=UPI002454165F|nr:amidohydrolase family protein [Pseudomonas sp. BN414]MDH4569032.1 hypothetical protein [Pseudomonas sp. BN414]
MNRRNFISTAGVILGGSAVLGALPVSAAGGPDAGSSPFRSGGINAKARRVDVHHHFVPTFWAEDLAKNGGDPSGWKMPKWSPETDIEFMDALGIDVAMLSLTAPGVAGWKGQAARDMARRVNEYAAGLGQDYQGRFGSFVTLPMQDIDGAIKELDYCLGRLKADGVILLSNYEGKLVETSFPPVLRPAVSRLQRVKLLISARIMLTSTRPAIALILAIILRVPLQRLNRKFLLCLSRPFLKPSRLRRLFRCFAVVSPGRL